jgi:hypothetical protein
MHRHHPIRTDPLLEASPFRFPPDVLHQQLREQPSRPMQPLVPRIIGRDLLQRHASHLQQVVGVGDDASQERFPRLGIVPVDARFRLEAGAEVAVEAALGCPDLGLLLASGSGGQRPHELLDPIAQQVVRVLNRPST